MPDLTSTRPSEQRVFTSLENQTWGKIISTQRPKRKKQIVDLFQKGLDLLEMDTDFIPNLDKVNKKLMALTGWQGVLVNGLESGESFYNMLKNRVFPLGNFVRNIQDLNYTPEPDIVHDFYGHIPFYADPDYANFNQKFGETAMKYVHQPEIFRQFERVFWFTCEFGLMKTSEGIKIFGAGIVSSIGECEYALSDKPEVLAFDLDKIRHQEFRIDEMQKRLFLLENSNQLYSILPELEKTISELR